LQTPRRQRIGAFIGRADDATLVAVNRALTVFLGLVGSRCRQCSFGAFRNLAQSPERTVRLIVVASRCRRSRTSAPALPEVHTRRQSDARSAISSWLTNRMLSPVRSPTCSAWPLSASPPIGDRISLCRLRHVVTRRLARSG